jgi:hypothetical protein
MRIKTLILLACNSSALSPRKDDILVKSGFFGKKGAVY